MGKRKRHKPGEVVGGPPPQSSSGQGIRIWKPVVRQQIASSVAKKMQEQGIAIPKDAEIVTPGQISGSHVPIDESLSRWVGLYPEMPPVVQARMKMRDGKKTWVCLGTAPDSCGLAPWNEPGISEWIGLNDAHHLEFMHMDKITRWCQVHQKGRYMRTNPRYDIDHWKWLQEKHHFPIYMQRHDPEVPSSVPIPLREFSEKFLAGRYARGSEYMRVLEMGSTFSYIIPMAIMEGAQRIEFYGVELAQEVEYVEQRPSTEFWMGIAGAHGVEIYVPQITRVLKAHFYGYGYPGPDETWPEAWRKMEDNVGDWPDFPDANDEIKKTLLMPGNWGKAAEEWQKEHVQPAAVK